MWEESEQYKTYPSNKEGKLIVDLYSYWRNKEMDLEKIIKGLSTNIKQPRFK